MKGSDGRRLGDRVASRVSAQMIDDTGCVTNIVVKDISPTGARLEATYGASIPKRFTLRMTRDRRDVDVELVWRNGVEAGVRFVPTQIDIAKPDIPAVAVSTPAARMSVVDLRKLILSKKR